MCSTAVLQPLPLTSASKHTTRICSLILKKVLVFSRPYFVLRRFEKKSGTWAFDVERDYQDDPWDRLSHATNLFALIELMQSLPSLLLSLFTHTHALSLSNTSLSARTRTHSHTCTHTWKRTHTLFQTACNSTIWKKDLAIKNITFAPTSAKNQT